jgi:hypothetical protein
LFSNSRVSQLTAKGELVQGKLSKRELGIGSASQQHNRIVEAMKGIRVQHRSTPLTPEEIEALRHGLKEERSSQERALDKIVDKLMAKLELD